MLNKQVTKLVADIALMASAAGLPKHAFGIYRGLELVDENNSVSTIGVALEFMNRRRFQESIDLLHAHLAKHPDQEEIKVFLGLALMLDGRNKESETVLNSLITTKDEKIAKMTTELLNDIHNK